MLSATPRIQEHQILQHRTPAVREACFQQRHQLGTLLQKDAQKLGPWQGSTDAYCGPSSKWQEPGPWQAQHFVSGLAAGSDASPHHQPAQQRSALRSAHRTAVSSVEIGPGSGAAGQTPPPQVAAPRSQEAAGRTGQPCHPPCAVNRVHTSGLLIFRPSPWAL